MNVNSDTNNESTEITTVENENSETQSQEKELDEKLNEHLKDEYKGVSEYVALSKKVPEEYKDIFVSMAREERGHAEMIEAILKDMCKYSFSNEILELKDKADRDLESV